MEERGVKERLGRPRKPNNIFVQRSQPSSRRETEDLGKNSSVLTSRVLFLLMTVSHGTSERD